MDWVGAFRGARLAEHSSSPAASIAHELSPRRVDAWRGRAIVAP